MIMCHKKIKKSNSKSTFQGDIYGYLIYFDIERGVFHIDLKPPLKQLTILEHSCLGHVHGIGGRWGIHSNIAFLSAVWISGMAPPLLAKLR